MRAKYLSGMLYKSFRQARSSVQPVWHGSSTGRFLSSTIVEKVPITQTMQFARIYENEKDLICPVKFFKEEADLLTSLDGNELLKAMSKKKKSEVSRKLAKAVRSLLKIICGNHAIGVACGDTLKLSNLRISRSLGEFAMLQQPSMSAQPLDNLRGDFARGADVLEELVREVLGSEAVMPKAWADLIGKMREQFPRVELMLYHSMFLPMSVRYWLYVVVDQRFRKDFSSLKKVQKDAICIFLKELGKIRKEDVASIVRNNEFIKFISLRSRLGSKGRKNKSNSNLSTDEAVFGDKACDIVAYGRDSVVHGCKDKLSEDEIAAMPSIENHWRTQDNIIQFLDEVFELLEQSYLDLCLDTKKVLWELLGIPELFGETTETWQAAIEAIERENELVKSTSKER